jgi:hypothetical protein
MRGSELLVYKGLREVPSGINIDPAAYDSQGGKRCPARLSSIEFDSPFYRYNLTNMGVYSIIRL